MHARYYHAGLARFISPDSIVPGAANPQAWNRYSYCANNPIRYADPSGHQSGNPPQSPQISSSSVAAAQTLQSDTTVEYDPTAIQSWPPDVYLAASEAAALARQEARQARAERIQDNVALGINCFTLLVTGILGPGVAAYSTPAAGSVEASKGGYGGLYYPPGQVGMAATVDELDGINDGLDYGKAPGWETTGQAGEIDLQRLANARQSLGLPSIGSEGQEKHTVAILEADGMEIWGVSAHGQDVSFPVNSISRTHAEIDALHQLFQHRAAAGVTGGRATMYVDRAPCLACGQNQGIRSGVRAVGLESLEIIYPGGSMIVKP